MPYVISFEDNHWNTDDLTLNEAIAIEEATGESWVFINPFRTARHWKAIASAFLTREMSPEDADKRIEEFSNKVGSVTEAIDATERVNANGKEPDE